MESKKKLNAPKITPKEDGRTRCRKCLLILIIKYNFRFLNIFFSNIAYSASYHDENIQKQNINWSRFERQTHNIPMHKDFLVRYLSDVVKNYHCRGIDRPCKFLLFEKELNIF